MHSNFFIFRQRLLTLAAIITSIYFYGEYANCDDGIQKIQKRGEIRLALESMFTGENLLSWRDGKSGEYRGLEIDLAKLIAKELGLRLTFVPTKWDRIREAVASGRADIGLQQLFIPTSPVESELWSVPYMTVGLAKVTKAGSSFQGTGFAKSEVVAVLNDDPVIKYLAERGVKTPRVFDSEARMIECVKAGICNSAVSDRPLLLARVKNSTGPLSISGQDLAGSEGRYGVLLNRDQHGLKKSVDRAIEKWRSSESIQAQAIKYGIKKNSFQ